MKVELVSLKPAKQSDKKYQVVLIIDGTEKKISFGAKGYRDFTLINKPSSKFYISDKKERNKVRDAYIKRHARMNENWKKSGIDTRGFWSRWLLWEKPTITASLSFIKKKFNLL